jgi:hypothetical protein
MSASSRFGMSCIYRCSFSWCWQRLPTSSQYTFIDGGLAGEAPRCACDYDWSNRRDSDLLGCTISEYFRVNRDARAPDRGARQTREGMQELSRTVLPPIADPPLRRMSQGNRLRPPATERLSRPPLRCSEQGMQVLPHRSQRAGRRRRSARPGDLQPHGYEFRPQGQSQVGAL